MSSVRTTVTSSKVSGGGSGGRSSGGGGGRSVSSIRHTSFGTGSRSGGGFSCRSSGGGYSGGGYAGGGFSGGSCGRISHSGFGGGISGGSYGGGFGSSCGGFGGFGGGYGGGYGGDSFGGSYGFSGSSFGGEDCGILSNNEKMTMQNLNDRLAAYLNKVKRLEEENDQLEHLIREWYQTQGPTGPLKNYSRFYGEIEDLNNQIVNSTVDVNKIILNIDNTRMTIEDFKLKYETELGLRQNVEGDINGLRPLLDQLTLARSDLEIEFESLKEELISLKKNHEEELRGLQPQSSGDVSVEVNASPGFNLTERLNELRHEYEQVIENNRREVERWYETQIKEVNQQVHVNGKDVETSNHQISELRREYQNLEIELQSQLSMIQSLQSSLDDTERRYNIQLQQIQGIIIPLEEELANIRCEMENQNQEYRCLLGIKIRLEQEIAQYRNLLDEGQQDIVISHGEHVISSGGRRGGEIRGGTFGTGGSSSGGSVISSGGRRGGEIGGGSFGGGVSSSGGGIISSGGGIGGESGGSCSRTGGGSCDVTGGGGSRRVSAGGSSSSHTYSSKSGERDGHSRKSFD